MFAFGSGVLIGTRTDVANATPVNFGLIQNVSIDDTATIKELFGQNQRPVAIARGTIKTTGKATLARISGLALASLYFGLTPVPGQIATAFGEAATVGSTPFQATVANAASFNDDAGVIYVSNGLPLTKVASAPALGQYSLNTTTGVYTFAAADTGAALYISYTYGITTSGQKFTVGNPLLGTTPLFKAKFYTTFQGNAVSLQLNQCTSSKLTMATKLEDFTMPDFEFSCFADAAGNVMTWSFGDNA